MQSNAVVVQGRAGVLLIDPGVTGSEIDCLANDLRELGQPVVAGFSTHPDWDHLLWHRPTGRPIGQAWLGVGERRARRATPAPRPKKRARRGAPLAIGVRHSRYVRVAGRDPG
ncbi:MBL fold metallo-hydrolase [Streptosporangium sp. NPDC049248]|uniref:MBL fold metallo-hydrolase n=1 Tax=Streptosporangium TaxID=2000 RepID=UPI0031DDC2BD